MYVAGPVSQPTADGCCMFHNQIAERLSRGGERARGPQLVTERPERATGSRALPELWKIAARRCSAFCAEAAVLVLVFGILDLLIQKGALGISVARLFASVGTEFCARRWLGAQP